jgi:hypothetical protein
LPSKLLYEHQVSSTLTQEQTNLKDAWRLLNSQQAIGVEEKPGKSKDPIPEQVATLKDKINRLDALSIGELERIQAIVGKYYSKLPKYYQKESGTDIESILYRTNCMLDQFMQEATYDESKRDRQEPFHNQ